MTKPKTGLRTLKSSLRTLPTTVRPLAAPSADYFNLYSHRRWRKRRAEHLQAEPLCRACWALDGLYVEATVADHVVPHGGDRVAFFTGLLASLCKDHHDGWKKIKEAAGDYSMPPAVTPQRTKPLVV